MQTILLFCILLVQVCKVESGRVIKCPLPPLKVSPAESRLSVDLQLDGKRYTNITQVTVVQDPQLIDDGNLDFRYPFEKTITIKVSLLIFIFIYIKMHLFFD